MKKYLTFNFLAASFLLCLLKQMLTVVLDRTQLQAWFGLSLGIGQISLSLSRRNITYISPNGTFAGFSKTESLYLDNNLLTSIDSSLFDEMISLRTLGLNINQIEYLDKNSFKNLNKLQVLYLSLNKLTRLDSDTFTGLNNLQVLWLQMNNINKIDPSAFLPLTNLQSIVLEKNNLTYIEPYTFINQNKAYSMSLSFNQFTSLNDPLIFNGLIGLKSLYLNDNQIKSVDSNLFVYLSNLEYLQMSNNSLSRID